MDRVKIFCESCGWYGVSSLTGEGTFEGGECPQCGEKIQMVVREGTTTLKNQPPGKAGASD